MKKFNLIIIALIFAISGASAQSPQAFKYQAVARDASGNVLQNQAIGMRISILQGSSSGTSVYKETHSETTNDFGLINLEIGNGTPVSGTFSSISWGTNDYFVKIEMDANGGTSYQHLGTSQLLSVPYALYAESSANGSSQWSQSGDNIYFNNGNVGIGTTSPEKALHIHGTASSPNPELIVESSSGGAYGGLRLQRNGVSNPATFITNGAQNSWINVNGGNVGIGTTNPTHKLSVTGTIRSYEVIVNTGWSDFVFEPDYNLLTLSEIELFIKENGHLPNIPSAEEVETNGVSIGNISSKLLQKIEELTLYTIDQEKEIETQKEQINNLQQENENQDILIQQLLQQNQEMLQRIEKLENTNSKKSEQ